MYRYEAKVAKACLPWFVKLALDNKVSNVSQLPNYNKQIKESILARNTLLDCVLISYYIVINYKQSFYLYKYLIIIKHNNCKTSIYINKWRKNMYKIILGSESPRRKEIMERMGIDFKTMPSHVKENIDQKNKKPSELVEALASLKARDVASRLDNEEDEMIIIGADTMVFYQGEVLGKPVDRHDAIKMLKLLSSHTHDVYTGVCIIIRGNKKDKLSNDPNKEIVFSVCTRVSVQSLTIDQIEEYVDSHEPYDKAGAYAIQGSFGIYISEIHGDYYNVVGFPIAKIYEKLLENNIDIKKQNKGLHNI